jgi:hypothetical protein
VENTEREMRHDSNSCILRSEFRLANWQTVARKVILLPGFQLAESSSMSTLQEFTERMSKEAMESLQQAAMANPASGPIPTAILVESSEPAKSAKNERTP